MAFYIINVGRNILINSKLKKILFMNSYKKKWNKTEEERNIRENENITDDTDFSENEIPHLSSLKPFEFQPKTNIEDINNSQKQPSEMFRNKRCSKKFLKTHRKTLVLVSFLNKEAALSPTTLLKRDSVTRIFLWILRKF